MLFEGFVGNADVKRQLSACVDKGQFPHALLIEGPVGSGRYTLARLIAQAAVCTPADDVSQKPCGRCSACLKTQGGGHPDIEEYGGDGSARSFHINTVREIRENAYLMPNEARYRVVILREAQAMTEQAQNALLKILEEPPSHLLCILTCQNRAQLLPTIQSRLLCLSLTGVSDEEALPVLKKRLPAVSEDALRRALRIFSGCIGQAIAGLESDALQEVLELTPQLALAVAAPTELPLLRLTGRLETNKEAVDGVLNGLVLVFRDSLAYLCGEQHFLSTAPKAAQTLAQSLTRAQLIRLIEAVQQLQQARLRNINHTLFLTLLCARLRAAVDTEAYSIGGTT